MHVCSYDGQMAMQRALLYALAAVFVFVGILLFFASRNHHALWVGVGGILVMVYAARRSSIGTGAVIGSVTAGGLFVALGLGIFALHRDPVGILAVATGGLLLGYAGGAQLGRLRA